MILKKFNFGMPWKGYSKSGIESVAHYRDIFCYFLLWLRKMCLFLAMLLFNKLNFSFLLFKENSWKTYVPQSTKLFLPQGICLKFCFHSLSQYLSASPLKMIFPDYCMEDTLLSLPVPLSHGCFFCHSQQYDIYLSVYFLHFFLESKLHTESTVQHIKGKK